MTLTLSQAEYAVDRTIVFARQLEIRIAVAVCNREGRLVAFKCMDGTYAEAGRQAIGKAVASAGTGLPSGEVTGVVYHPFASVAVSEGMPVMRMRGGLPILKDGEILGGCGVDGATSNESDEECARALIAAFPA